MLTMTLLAQGLPEGVEPNNTIATACLLPAGVQACGEITADDEDWFKISLAADRDYKIWTGPGFVSQIGDTKVRILASDGTTVIVDVDDGNTTTHGYYTTFQGALSAGDYFVCVRGYSATTTGTYTLDVVLAAPGTYEPLTPSLTAAAEGPENNDPRTTFGSGTATPATFFTQSLGNVTAGGSNGTSIDKAGSDYDWYEISVAVPGIYVFRTTATGTTASPVDDTVLHLCDDTFARITYNDDLGGTYSQITWDITTPGTYYVVVSGYYGTSAGDYLLDILGLTPALPSGAATVTVHAGGCTGSSGTPALSVRATSSNPNAFPEVPVLGSEFFVDATSLVPGTAVIGIIGFLEQSPAFNLARFGFPGCGIEVNPIGLPYALADANGSFFWCTSTVPVLSLVGLPLEYQLMMLDPTPTPGIAMSNRLSAVCGVTH